MTQNTASKDTVIVYKISANKLVFTPKNLPKNHVTDSFAKNGKTDHRMDVLLTGVLTSVDGRFLKVCGNEFVRKP